MLLLLQQQETKIINCVSVIANTFRRLNHGDNGLAGKQEVKIDFYIQGHQDRRTTRVGGAANIQNSHWTSTIHLPGETIIVSPLMKPWPYKNKSPFSQ